jgi:hypothetical protein
VTFVEAPLLPVNPDWQNFKGLQDEVLSFGFNDGPQVNRSRIKAWINEALRQIAREVEAPEFQATEDLEMTAGDYKYPLPGSFLRMQDIYYPEMLIRLKPVDLQRFDQSSPRRVEGPPMTYTLYRNELWLFPTPGTGDTLELRYIETPAQLATDTDVPSLNPDYWHLLIAYAVARAFEGEDDPESAQAHMTRYKSDLAAYATDVQDRLVDRPRQVDGTWGTASIGGAW